ncbi:hypothetical protein K8R33_03025 [archaeon]|nr:hypothetical protein [archaeon]
MKKIIYSLIILFCINLSNATTLHGDIYDWDLELTKNVLVSINSIPEQNQLSTDGSYSFELNSGDYTLYAKYEIGEEIIASTTEEITIEEDGKFRYDIILFPEFEEDLEDIDITELDFNEKSKDYYTFILIGLILIVIFLLLKKKNPKKHLEEDETEKVLEIIKKQGGRTTQKEIRKCLALSEAKVSLMITELEHKNKIEKIKKGRGNIIILKK